MINYKHKGKQVKHNVEDNETTIMSTFSTPLIITAATYGMFRHLSDMSLIDIYLLV